MISFFWTERCAEGDELRLRGDPVQHARAKRVETGEPARVLDGRGWVGTGAVVGVSRDQVTVSVGNVVEIPKPVALEVIVPVADRDRMLMAAEKCVELQVTAWRPAYFARSRSVSPRGEGDKFRDKVRARMQAALEQSGGAWLPEVHPERDAPEVLSAVPTQWARLLLDSRGTSLARHISLSSLAIAVGPEGGLESLEIENAVRDGWILASLGQTILRFETAVIAAVAVARATQFGSMP